MQQTMLDSAKFVDMLHNVPWEDGLPKDVVYGTWTCLPSCGTYELTFYKDLTRFIQIGSCGMYCCIFVIKLKAVFDVVTRILHTFVMWPVFHI